MCFVRYKRKSVGVSLRTFFVGMKKSRRGISDRWVIRGGGLTGAEDLGKYEERVCIGMLGYATSCAMLRRGRRRDGRGGMERLVLGKRFPGGNLSAPGEFFRRISWARRNNRVYLGFE